MVLILQRTESSDHGTFGRLSLDGKNWNLFTGELPWRNNQPEISCVPLGLYECAWTYSPHFKKFCYEVKNVPDREGIRFHVANFFGDKSKGLKSEVNGCLGLGEKMGFIDGQRALMLSRQAITRFEDWLRGEPFLIEITD